MRNTAHVCTHLILQNENSTTLLGLRQNTGYEDGSYALVSGHVEKDEGAIVGMIREAREEIGIVIDKKDLEYLLTMHHKSNRENMHLFFSCKKWSGSIQNNEPEKCTELTFFSFEALPKNIVPYHRYALECIQKGIQYAEFGF